MSRFGVFWLPWLTTAASGSCRLKSAAAIDAEDVPVAHHADESCRLRSASTYTLTSRLSSAATDKQAEQRRDQTYCEPPPLKLAQAIGVGLALSSDVVGFAMAMREAPALCFEGRLHVSGAWGHARLQRRCHVVLC